MSSYLFRLLTNYLTGKSITMIGNFNSVTKNVSKGYPQDSILGLELWNLVFDSLLCLKTREVRVFCLRASPYSD